ncbi:uncharacterized protein V1518DRAFT_408069 [Limtongia smithiae]|uniref:uncharacterized protein n=1 Tax=Limtongia smithiae TaxID=1125753 RepID=UPI0034CE8A65
MSGKFRNARLLSLSQISASSNGLPVNRRMVTLFAVAVFATFVLMFVHSLGPNKVQSFYSWSSPDPHGVARESLPQAVIGNPDLFNPDYPEGIEDVFLMVKTGATVLWKRLPIHFQTTFKQVPFFQVYSDMAETIANHQVVDALQNVSAALKSTDDFELWRIQQEMLEHHSNVLPQDHWGIAKNKKGWELDKYKNLPMLQHAWSVNPNAKWYIFMDADSYILWTPLMAWLKTLNYRHALYMGSPVGNPPIRFGHGGSGVVISRGTMLRTFGQDPDLYKRWDKETIRDCCGDHMVARAFYKLGVKIAEGDGVYPYAKWKFQGEPEWLVFGNQDNWCSPIMSFHHISPQDIQKIYEFEQEFKATHHKDEYIRYVDVYHKFMHAWLEDEKQDWDNRSNDREYSATKPKAFRDDAYESLEKCRAKCDEWDECVGYRYNIGFCGLSRSVRLGRRVIRWEDDLFDDSKLWISGWKLDRIRAMRAASGCDPLAADEPQSLDESQIVPGLEVPPED